MKFKIVITLLLISNFIINTNSVTGEGLGFPAIFTYIANFSKGFLILLFLNKIQAIKKIPRHLKYFIYFEFFVLLFGLFNNQEYYQIKNTVFYFLPQILTLSIAYLYYNDILKHIQFLTKISIILLLLGFYFEIEGLALQKTFSHLYILGIIHLIKSEYRYQIAILLMYLLLISFGIESRITFIRFGTLLFCTIFYYLLKFELFRKYSKKITILSSIILVVLLVSLFNKTGKLELEEVVYDDYNIAADTRSLVYKTVINSTKLKSEIIFGRGASAKYETFFYAAGGTTDNYRYRNEIDILNKYLYGGLLYVVSFFYIVFYRKVKIENRENEILGIFLVFFCLMSLVENTSEYSTLWLLFWFLTLNYKNVRLSSSSSHS